MDQPSAIVGRRVAPAAAGALLGAAIALTLGATAGAALKPRPGEAGSPVAPQQICTTQARLTQLERAGKGWPMMRAPGAPSHSLFSDRSGGASATADAL